MADAPTPAPRRSIWVARLLEPEMFIGLAALLVSVCAVLVSIYGAALDRQHARAEVWPHLELSLTVSSEGAMFDLVNTGIGPAAIHQVEFTIDGRPAAGWSAIFAAVLDRSPTAYAVSTASERVLPAGGQLRLLHLPPDVLPPDFTTRLRRIGARVCYGSAFEEHWQLHIPKLMGRATTTDAARCPTATGDDLPF